VVQSGGVAYPKLVEAPEPAAAQARGFALKERAGALRGACARKDGPESGETRRREASTRWAAAMPGVRRREQQEMAGDDEVRRVRELFATTYLVTRFSKKN
jgi:hypothetical protein